MVLSNLGLLHKCLSMPNPALNHKLNTIHPVIAPVNSCIFLIFSHYTVILSQFVHLTQLWYMSFLFTILHYSYHFAKFLASLNLWLYSVCTILYSAPYCYFPSLGKNCLSIFLIHTALSHSFVIYPLLSIINWLCPPPFFCSTTQVRYIFSVTVPCFF